MLIPNICEWKFQRLLEKLGLIKAGSRRGLPSINECREIAIEDACDYIGCDKSGFIGLAKKWSEVYPKLLSAKKESDFYKSCVGEIGYSNICANIEDQFARERVFKAISMYLVPGMKMLDFGSAAGALSYCFKDIASEIHFLDFDNELTRYLRSRIGRYPNIFLHDIEKPETLDGLIFDLIVCVDVLEHLRNPSDVFINRIDPKLKKGGVLLLTAPWGGAHITHIEEAPIDWYRNGSKVLANKYRRKFIIQPIDVSGIYIKVKE